MKQENDNQSPSGDIGGFIVFILKNIPIPTIRRYLMAIASAKTANFMGQELADDRYFLILAPPDYPISVKLPKKEGTEALVEKPKLEVIEINGFSFPLRAAIALNEDEFTSVATAIAAATDRLSSLEKMIAQFPEPFSLLNEIIKTIPEPSQLQEAT